MKRLKQGKPVSDYQTISLINAALDAQETKLKGFLLDLPFYKRTIPWAELIRRGRIHAKKFSYIIELNFSDEDVLLRAQRIRCDPETGETLSEWERLERKKPKPKKPKNEDDEEENQENNEENQEENQENKPKIMDESKIIQLGNDMRPQIDNLLAHYNNIERPELQSLINDLPYSAYIPIASAAGYTPAQLLDAALAKIPEKDLLRPLAKSLEPEGDFKALLTQGLEENAVPRRFSSWKKVDPVSLFSGKIEFGLPDQATTYGGYVFVHANENNKKEFVINPKKYLQKPPFMPKEYRIALVGQRGAGKKTQAAELAKLYGWKIIDVEQLIKGKVEEFKGKISRNEKIKANNPETKEKLYFSQPEYASILQGKGVELKDGLVFMLEEYGIEMEKRKPPKAPEDENANPDKTEEKKVTFEEPELKEGEEGEVKKEEKKEEKKQEPEKIEPEFYEDEDMDWFDEIVYPEGWFEEQKRIKEEEEKKAEEAKKAAEEAKKLEEQKALEGGQTEQKKEEKQEEKAPEEEEIEYEDLALSDLVAKQDEKGQIKFFGGYILIGMPTNEEQIARLKEMGIVPDKIIFLSDTNEEAPGEEIKKRVHPEDPYHNVEADAEYIKKAKALCTEAYTEANIIEVNCNKEKSNVLYQICAALDPFFPQIDDVNLVAKVTADLQEGQRPLPKGEYADYCPVVLKKENLLIIGDPETEVQYKGKTYRFAGQTEMEEFKINPAVFVKEMPQRPPEPHIMILGCRGAGVTTQLKNLSRTYQLPIVEIKEELFKKLETEKAKRKEMRRLLKGFKPKPPGIFGNG